MPITIKDVPFFENQIKSTKLSVIHFSVDWLEQCKQIDEVLNVLSKDEYKEVSFFKCQAEDLTQLSLKYNIAVVPTVLLFKSGKLIDSIEGADAAKITSRVKHHSNEEINESQNILENRLKSLINLGKIVLFMKGDRRTPKCGFSRKMIDILNETGVKYETFDVLKDEEVRQGLKIFSDWPTYPQLYARGEFIGGLDIIKEMHAGGELLSTLNA